MRVAAFLILFGALAGSRILAAPTPLNAARHETFVVQAMLDERQAEIGSGVVIERAGGVLTLATAAHLVDRHLPLRILDESRNAYYEVLGVTTISGYDLALVRVRERAAFSVEPAPLGTAFAGEGVWIWGSPAAGFWELASGRVTGAGVQLPGSDGARRITIDCPMCTFGDSGSGVFDADGKLVGILSGGWRDNRGRVLFVQVEPVTPLAQIVDIVK